MRRLLVVPGFTAVVAAFAACVSAPPPEDGAAASVARAVNATTFTRPGAKEVMVHIACTNGGVNSSVAPWTVREPAGTELSWRLSESGNADSILIRNVSRTAPWVLDNAPPYRARRGVTAAGGRLQPANGAVRSQYAIEFWCRNDGTGDPVHGVIDPDIIVIQ